MPTPSEDTARPVATSEQLDASHSGFSEAISSERDARLSRRASPGSGAPRSLARDADCTTEAKVEESNGVPTPPPSEPETADRIPRRRLPQFEGSVAEAGRDAANQDRSRVARPGATPGLSTPQPDTIDNETSRACSLSSLSPRRGAHRPQYLYYPEIERERNEKLTTSFLRPGSKFIGTQTSDRQRYEVQVEIKDVDLEESYLCGYLRIQGLTDDHPTLTTFFGGEVIGPKYMFKTTHDSWGSSDKNDMTHWACFPDWRKLAKAHRSPNFTAPNHLQREHLYMRWKENFLVPDHRVKTIAGASFEGFYYVCFNQRSGCIDGVYFHAKSEKWQQLRLEHVDDRGCAAAIEFR